MHNLELPFVVLTVVSNLSNLIIPLHVLLAAKEPDED